MYEQQEEFALLTKSKWASEESVLICGLSKPKESFRTSSQWENPWAMVIQWRPWSRLKQLQPASETRESNISIRYCRNHKQINIVKILTQNVIVISYVIGVKVFMYYISRYVISFFCCCLSSVFIDTYRFNYPLIRGLLFVFLEYVTMYTYNIIDNGLVHVKLSRA